MGLYSAVTSLRHFTRQLNVYRCYYLQCIYTYTQKITQYLNIVLYHPLSLSLYSHGNSHLSKTEILTLYMKP